MAEVLTVLTYKSAHHIVSDGGTQSWVIGRRRAARCAYVVCVRHQQGPFKAEGSELHKHAFLIGKVSGVSLSNETDEPSRFRVEMSEYAAVSGPHIPLNSASPTQYFPSLTSIGIDEASLHWKPICNLPSDVVTSSPVDAFAEDDLKDAEDGESITAMSVFLQAKKLVANGLTCR